MTSSAGGVDKLESTEVLAMGGGKYASDDPWHTRADTMLESNIVLFTNIHANIDDSTSLAHRGCYHSQCSQWSDSPVQCTCNT